MSDYTGTDRDYELTGGLLINLDEVIKNHTDNNPDQRIKNIHAQVIGAAIPLRFLSMLLLLHSYHYLLQSSHFLLIFDASKPAILDNSSSWLAFRIWLAMGRKISSSFS